jgi:HEPN domain-containing protein
MSMIDVGKQVAFWRDGSVEDWDVACELVRKRRIRHGLFFAHLAIEKLLKALVVQNTGELAPRVHSLVRLAEVAGVAPDEAQMDTLAEMNAFNIEGRYPELLTAPPSPAEAKELMRRAEEVKKWLTAQLR